MKPDWNQQEDLAIPVVDETEHVLEVAPHKVPQTPGEWLKENLFATPLNTVLTILTALVAGYIGWAILRWAFVTADWTVVKLNFRLYMIGRFPIEEAWRVWLALYYVTALVGLTWGRTGRRFETGRVKIVRRSVLGALFVAVLLYLVESPLVWGLMIGAAAMAVAGTLVGRAAGRDSATMRRVVSVGWILSFPFTILVLQMFGGVSPLRWGGVLLNVLVAVVGIVLSFPIGVFLALGRRGSFPAIRIVCVGLIEFVRGAPLYAWLLFGQFLLPFLLPPGLVLPPIMRAMIMFTLFSSAYVAEIVRGGLQGVHFGQYEAARALGLSTTRMMTFIVMPQALRNVIPSMISHFISLFKDTSLLAIIGFIEALRIARVASASARFVGTSRQTLLFAAAIFWIVAFTMSRWSQRLERRLGVGER